MCLASLAYTFPMESVISIKRVVDFPVKQAGRQLRIYDLFGAIS